MEPDGRSEPSTAGGVLVKSVRENLPEVEVFSIPGPTALTAAASISGINMDRFLFLGFLPHKKGKQTLIKKVAKSEWPVIFYESPYRLIKTLQMMENFINNKRQISVAKEITKINEQVIIGTIEEVNKYFENNPDKVKGEFVVIVNSG